MSLSLKKQEKMDIERSLTGLVVINQTVLLLTRGRGTVKDVLMIDKLSYYTGNYIGLVRAKMSISIEQEIYMIKTLPKTIEVQTLNMKISTY